MALQRGERDCVEKQASKTQAPEMSLWHTGHTIMAHGAYAGKSIAKKSKIGLTIQWKNASCPKIHVRHVVDF